MNLLREKRVIGENKIVQYSNKANISICCDKNVIRALGVTIFSFLQYTSTPCVFHIFFNGQLPKDDEKKLVQLVKQYKTDIVIYWLNNDFIEDLKSNLLNITVTTYYRLVVPYVLHELPIDRVLYVDTDVLCTNDISPLCTMDLQNKIAFVEKDATSKPNMRQSYCPKIGMKGTDYFNAGVMLINIELYVKEDIGYKAIKLASTNSYPFMDQDVLNILLEGKTLFSTTYSYDCAMSVRNHELPDVVRIIHFTGGKKPWKLYTTHYGTKYTDHWKDEHSWKYAYYKAWRECAQQSPWADIPYELPKTYHDWRYIANMYRVMGKYSKFISAYCQYLCYKLFK